MTLDSTECFTCNNTAPHTATNKCMLFDARKAFMKWYTEECEALLRLSKKKAIEKWNHYLENHFFYRYTDQMLVKPAPKSGSISRVEAKEAVIRAINKTGDAI